MFHFVTCHTKLSGAEKEEQRFLAAGTPHNSAAATSNKATFATFLEYRRFWGQFLIREARGSLKQLMADVRTEKVTWHRAQLSRERATAGGAAADSTTVAISVLTGTAAPSGPPLIATDQNIVVVRNMRSMKLLFLRPMRGVSYDNAGSWVQCRAAETRVAEFFRAGGAMGGKTGTTAESSGPGSVLKVEMCNPGNLVSLVREVEAVVKAETCLGKFALLGEYGPGAGAGGGNESLIAQTLLKGAKAFVERAEKERAAKSSAQVGGSSGGDNSAKIVGKGAAPPPPKTLSAFAGAKPQSFFANKPQQKTDTTGNFNNIAGGVVPQQRAKHQKGVDSYLLTACKSFLQKTRDKAFEQAKREEGSAPGTGGGSLNDSQASVINTVDRNREGFTLVHGPPGTGKSTTMGWILNVIFLRDWDLW